MFSFENITLNIMTLFPAEQGDDNAQTMAEIGLVIWRETEPITITVNSIGEAMTELQRMTDSIFDASTGALFAMGEINNIKSVVNERSIDTIQLRHVKVRDDKMAKWLEEQMGEGSSPENE